MEQVRQTSEQYFKQLAKIHLLIILSTLILNFAIAYVSFSNPLNIHFNGFSKLISTILPIIAIPLSVVYGRKHVNKIASKIRHEKNINTISKTYRQATLMRFAMIEGAIFFNTIMGLLITNSYLFAAAALGTLYLVTLKPSAKRLILEVDPLKEIKILYETGHKTVFDSKKQ